MKECVRVRVVKLNWCKDQCVEYKKAEKQMKNVWNEIIYV